MWSHRDIRLVIPGRAVSYFGDSLTMVILSLQIAESGNPARMSAFLIAFSLPLFLLAVLAGRIVDEHDSRTLLTVAGTLQVTASIGLVMAPSFAAILSFVVLLQIGQAVTGPTWGALVPRIVGDDLVGKAVGTQQSLSALAGLAGAATAGVLYDLIGYRGALLFDTATFATLVVIGALVRTRRGRRFDGGDRPVERSGGGWRHIRHDRLLVLLVPAMWLFILTAEATNVVEVFMIRNELGASPAAYGALIALAMAGFVLGPVLAGWLSHDHARITWATVTAASIGVADIGIGLSQTVWMIAPILFVVGIAVGAINALLAALVVTRPAEAVRGRVLSTMNGVGRGFSVLAMVLGGLGSHLIGPRGTYLVCGLLCLATSYLVLHSRKGLRDAPRSLLVTGHQGAS